MNTLPLNVSDIFFSPQNTTTETRMLLISHLVAQSLFIIIDFIYVNSTGSIIHSTTSFIYNLIVMDQLWTNLPPVTKSWCVSIAATGALLSSQKVKSMNLLFIPDKALSTQPWRLITTFCAFDGLSLELFLELFFISSSCGRVEEVFSTKLPIMPEQIVDGFDNEQGDLLQKYIERNRAIDFLYYMIQICVSIVIFSSILHYKLGVTIYTLGGVLCRALMYIDSQNNPHELVNFMGLFTIKKLYYPWIEAGLTIMITGNVGEDVMKLAHGNFGIFKNPVVWFYLLSIMLGHFWWVSREFLLTGIHYDSNDRRRASKSKALMKYGVYKVDLTRELLCWLLLPPWYWIILSEIKNRRRQ